MEAIYIWEIQNEQKEVIYDSLETLKNYYCLINLLYLYFVWLFPCLLALSTGKRLN